MRRLFLVLVWFFASGSFLLGIPESPDPSAVTKKLNDNGNTLVRVLIDRAPDAVHLSTFAPHLKVEVENTASPFLLGRDLAVSLSSDRQRFLIRNKTIPMKWLAISSGDGISPLSFQGHVYRGALWLRIREGKIWVINVLPMETYLLGTLGAEMNASWELDALKAQAVASRTYALSKIQHRRTDLYDVEKTIQDQVYDGVQAENPAVRKAIEQTAGEIVVQNHRPLRAYYHSRCGGNTESPTTVWNGNTETARVPCPYCRKFPYLWKVSFTFEEVRKALGLDTSGHSLRLASLEKSDSGRITRLQVTDGYSEKTLTSDQLRNRLGYQKLKSALFHWQIHENNITFEGLGAGHGVGMCQWGARFLAQQGRSYRQILAYYYPGTTIELTR